MPAGTSPSERRVLLVDDDETVCRALRRTLRHQDLDFDEFHSAEEALEGLEQGNKTFAVIMTDLRLPGKDGLELLMRSKDFQPLASTVLISAHFDLKLMEQAANRRQVDFIVAKPWQPDQLIDILEQAVDFFFQRLYDTKTMQDLTASLNDSLQHCANLSTRPSPSSNDDSPAMDIPQKPISILTSRETQVLACICKGLSPKEIGFELGISRRTANMHRQNLMRKLSIDNVPGLVTWAMRHQLLQR